MSSVPMAENTPAGTEMVCASETVLQYTYGPSGEGSPRLAYMRNSVHHSSPTTNGGTSYQTIGGS